jgi:hypothetical protein
MAEMAVRKAPSVVLRDRLRKNGVGARIENLPLAGRPHGSGRA